MPVLPLECDSVIPKDYESKDLFSWTPFTYPFNLTKHPSSTINCGFSSSGLPVGIQVVAPHYEDKRCFQVSAYLEKVFSLTNIWPKIFNKEQLLDLYPPQIPASYSSPRFPFK